MAYRLWVRCVSEVIGMMVAIYLAQSNVANELLAYTKGHGMGFGWLSFGYGLAFSFAILLVGWISAFFNPALALAAWINGNGITTAGEFFAISGSCILGGFLGGILVFLQFWPHFQIVPKPPTEIIITCARYVEEQRESLDGRAHDPMEQPMYNSNTGVSYDNLAELDVDEPNTLHCTKWTPPHLRAAKVANGKAPAESDSNRPSGDSAREHSKPLKRQQVQQEKAKRNALNVTTSTELRGARFGGIDTAPDPHLDTLHNSLRQLIAPFRHAHRAMEQEMEVAKLRTDLEKTMEGADGCKSPTKKEEAAIMQQMEEGNSEDRAVAAKYVKAIEKDQIAKLLCFCTRPAIYSPAYNWLCEFISTIVLIVTIFVFQTQLGRVFPGGSPQFNMASAVFVGVLIILLVVGPGGPTGVAMSPARDFGPRLAHWVLPIKGKGSSEFLSYSWIPFTASLCGAVPAAFITRGINQMIESAATYAVL